MSKSEENDKNTIKRIGPGDLLSFGSVYLLLTLNIEKEDMNKYKINWRDLKSLENVKFIAENKNLWKKVELSSTNDTINILLQINQLSKKLIKIGYVGFKRITYKDEQVEFSDFIETITSQKGIFLTSCDVCKCIISIQLLLRYKDKEKIFVLSGVPIPIKKDINHNDKNNNLQENNKNNEGINEEKKNNNDDIKKEKENKSEEEDQDNPLTNITDDVINPGEFNYIYFNFSDYTTGEFSGRIKIEHLYEYFQNLKITTNSKIILNLKDEILNQEDENIKGILSITDMYIFYNKNKLYDILKRIKEQEDNQEIKKAYQHYLKEQIKKKEEMDEYKEKEKEYIDNYRHFLEKEKMKKEKKQFHTLKKEKININGSIYLTQNDKNFSDRSKINQLINISLDNKEKIQKSLDKEKNYNIKKIRLNTESTKDIQKSKTKSNSINAKNLKIKLTPIIAGHPKPLDKNEMFDYFKYGICDRDPQKKSQDKIALVLDEFKKIFFIKCNKKREKPEILDFDLNLHPKMNLRNMKEILEAKKYIQSNFYDYTKTFFGSMLGTIVSEKEDGPDEKSLFLAYLVGMNTMKKMVEIQKNDLPMPKNKDFFSTSINKGEIKRLLTEANQRKKEKLFVLDGNTKNNIGIKPYNPLLDKNLAAFFSTKNNQNFLKRKGFLGKNGEIIYDPLYRDTYQNTNNPYFNKNNYYENRIINNSLNNKKSSNHKKIKFKSMTTNKFLYGFRKKSPGYSIYNETRKNGVILPSISPENKKRINYNRNKSRIKEEKSEEIGRKKILNYDKSENGSKIVD